MKYEFPDNHGLSDSIVADLVYKEGGGPALSDVQYDALEAGVGRGASLLAVSPTSTGKTLIALWAIAKGLEAGCNTVYLVTHRALAKQKFEDLKSHLLEKYLDDNHEGLVVATGDYVQNANGENAIDPLSAPLLIATYEKYLALLSASGIPSDMGHTIVVCDEIQLIGDVNRGQTVEILLTLLRNAGWQQFVGLSAVLERQDASDLANWLRVPLVMQFAREKHLRYECWTPAGMAAVSSQVPDNIEENIPLPTGVAPDPLAILASLLSSEKPPTPIIVFSCARKQDTYDLAEAFINRYLRNKPKQFPLPFDGIPETAANTLLSRTLAQRIAIHNADLMEEERHVVEQYLAEGRLDVVFATATLAAGVNFPLGAAIFADWHRYNFARRIYEPIPSDEFHNMAGRVGRMGFDHGEGRVIYIAESRSDIRNAREYLNLGKMAFLESRVVPDRFNQLALQLVASGLCENREELLGLVCGTLSALREQDRNPVSYSQWPELLDTAIDGLLAEGQLLQTTAGKLIATPVGKAVGFSGLLPETASFLLDYAARKYDGLTQLLPTSTSAGDVDQLAFVLFCACFSSPEFRSHNRKAPTRFLPWPLGNTPLIDANIYLDNLPEKVWQADMSPINAAKLALDWIEGAELRVLETSLPSLSAGMLREMFRNLIWVLHGYSSILAAAVDTLVPVECRPPSFRTENLQLSLIGKLPRVARRLCFRLNEGLPDDVLWMKWLDSEESDFRLSRNEILGLRAAGYVSPDQIMLGSPEADAVRIGVFQGAQPTPQAKSNWLRDTCRNWKNTQRSRAEKIHKKRADKCPNKKLVEDIYRSRGNDFEEVFEKVLATLGITFEKLDDKTKTGAPDYLVKLDSSPPLIVELKSKNGEKLVDYNKAVEVLAASEIHGYRDVFCVTLCHPGVDPSVPLAIAACGRLSVVELSDLCEGLLRICEGTLTQNQVYHWLASPGQALAVDLPYREYV